MQYNTHTHHTNTWMMQHFSETKFGSPVFAMVWFWYVACLHLGDLHVDNLMDGMSMVNAYSPQLYDDCTYIPRTQMTHILEDLTLLKWKINPSIKKEVSWVLDMYYVVVSFVFTVRVAPSARMTTHSICSKPRWMTMPTSGSEPTCCAEKMGTWRSWT